MIDEKKVKRITEIIDQLMKTARDNEDYSTAVHSYLPIGQLFYKLRSTKVLDAELYEYDLTTKDNIKQHWEVVDGTYFKIVIGYTEQKVAFYHYYFNKIDGYTIRYGKTYDEDPEMCELGPEILDIEISVNGCPKVGGHNCKFCYKNNTDQPPTNMTLEQFKTIINKFPKNLSQIAIGITGTKTNPDFIKIMEYCHEIGIIPNYTLSGADMDEEMAKATTSLCGACAVSCYEGAKELCYNTIKTLHKIDDLFPINMHIVLSKGTLNHLWDVLHDIKDGKVEGLQNIVFLRIKPVGRAKNLDCIIEENQYKDIIQFCMDNKIGFGFDSCGAKRVMKVLHDIGKDELIKCCESCESTSFSFYCNTYGIATPCSFCEHLYGNKGINMFDVTNFSDVWNTNDMLIQFRKGVHNCKESCSIYKLD